MKNEQWEEVSSRARAVLNYGVAQKEWLEKSRMARFITAIPFIAECKKPLETSFSHLIIYLVSLDESAKEIYFHKPHDDGDIYSRLRPLLCCYGGDQDILWCCKDLLALCMISNYKRDAADDREIGKYNPLNNNGWDGDALIEDLSTRIQNKITPEIAEFYTLQEALRGYWQD